MRPRAEFAVTRCWLWAEPRGASVCCYFDSLSEGQQPVKFLNLYEFPTPGGRTEHFTMARPGSQVKMSVHISMVAMPATTYSWRETDGNRRPSPSCPAGRETRRSPRSLGIARGVDDVSRKVVARRVLWLSRVDCCSWPFKPGHFASIEPGCITDLLSVRNFRDGQGGYVPPEPTDIQAISVGGKRWRRSGLPLVFRWEYRNHCYTLLSRANER